MLIPSCPTQLCACGKDTGSVEHFLLHCPLHTCYRYKMIASIELKYQAENVRTSGPLMSTPSLVTIVIFLLQSGVTLNVPWLPSCRIPQNLCNRRTQSVNRLSWFRSSYLYVQCFRHCHHHHNIIYIVFISMQCFHLTKSHFTQRVQLSLDRIEEYIIIINMTFE